MGCLGFTGPCTLSGHEDRGGIPRYLPPLLRKVEPVPTGAWELSFAFMPRRGKVRQLDEPLLFALCGQGKVEGGSFSPLGFRPELSLVVLLDNALTGKQAQSVSILLDG